MSGSQNGVVYTLHGNGSQNEGTMTGTGNALTWSSVADYVGGAYWVTMPSGSSTITVATTNITYETTAAGGTITAPNGTVLPSGGGSLNLTIQPTVVASDYSYQWFFNGAPLNNTNVQTYTATQAGSYFAVIHNTCSGAQLPAVSIVVNTLNLSQNHNYIVNYTPRVSGITTNNQLYAAAINNTQVETSVDYFDGLGRLMQTVQAKGSPAGNDIVQPVAYDAFGRDATKYLPYAISSSTTSDGSYKTNALTSGAGVFAFYNPTGSGPSGVAQQTNGIPVTADPFAVTGYEPSPLNRVVEQGAQGESYQFSGPGSSSSSYHTQKVVYTGNNQVAFSSSPVNSNPGSQQVALYTATINSDQSRTLTRANATTYYATGTLYVTVSYNENWQPANGCVGSTEEYKDLSGRVVLKRTYDVTPAGNVEMLSTYYVYDTEGNLCFVLTPGASPDTYVTGAPGGITQATLDNFCYQYRYDARNRLSQKQLPGTGWDFTVYNKLDQVVMTQTPNQRDMTTQQWTFTKYDGMGREIITGIYSYSGAGLDASVDSPNQTYFQNLSSTYAGLTTNIWEAPLSTAASGYNGLSYPTGQSFTFYKINFYDNYSAIPSLPATYDQHASTAYSTMLTGLPTATKTYVLNTTQALWTVNYYNDLGEIIRTFKQHYLGGSSALSVYNYDDINTVYNFVKQPLAVTRYHYESNGGTSAKLALTVADTYTYDQLGRKINSYQQLTDHANTPQAQVLVAQNVYNEVGQLMKKNLYAVSPFTSFLQSVNYRYNPRGWLSYINNASLSNDAGLTSNETTDQFGEELYYDNTTTGIPQYNGNISSIKWKSGNTSAGTQSQLGYDYRYDALNRMMAGVSLTAGTKNHFYDEYANYSNMGNITSLGRYDQVTAGTTTQIDTLSYTYSTNNQLMKVIDNATYTGTLGFVPPTGIKPSTEYKWDLNGNETYDFNKTINTINYNLLNLPNTITFNNGNTVVYIYDAEGTKLRKVSTTGSVVSTTEYVDGVEYDPNGTSTPTITFLETEEGRARWNATSSRYIYEYDLKDHLGNTRVTFNNSGSGGALQILQEDNYYPFGSSIGSLYPLAPQPANNYLYNHKELQPETGLYDYGARFYDPVIGRWTSVDPLAEKDRRWSPYAYAFNNPIRFIDPDGMWGDIYNENGTHIGNDGIDDNKAYVAKTTDNTQLTQDQSLNYTTTANAIPANMQTDATAYGLGIPVVQQLSVSNSDLVQLAGVAYAESDAKSPNHDETYGIASAAMNNYNAESNDPRSGNPSLPGVLNKVSNATFDGNTRYGDFMNCTTPDGRNANSAMTTAMGAAVNATSGGKDYSNGATGWDGRDLPTNSHRFGLLNTNPANDIYHLGNKPKADGTYVRDVTGAAGHTVFMKIDPAFVKRTGSPAY